MENASERMEKFTKQHLDLPYCQDVSILGQPVQGDGFTVPNAFCIQPMEGCDGTAIGAPGELTTARYEGFAAGGAGMLWMEAVAVVNEGRANPRQLHICPQTADEFKRLRERIDEVAHQNGHASPKVIMQLTHSGRFSNYSGNLDPVCAWRHASLDGRYAKQSQTPPVSDEVLRALPEKFYQGAKLAKACGYDGVDVKACHLYLFSELLSCYDRPGPYGGSFDNRTRLLMEAVEAARAADPGILACRLNIYDAMPMGFGVKTDGSLDMDLTEPMALQKKLADAGVRLIDVTMGTPYFNPHINRPYNSGGYTPPETQETGVHRLLSGARAMVQNDSRTTIVGTGFTNLAAAAAPVAAGCVRDGWVHLAGIGRLAFACPSFPQDAIAGQIKQNRLCLCCGKCTELMRAGSTAGCPVRNPVYAAIYRRDVMKK
nr:flavin oxidoreductase/NADH oxidase [bacterium]